MARQAGQLIRTKCFSYCLERDPSLAKLRRPLKITVVTCGVLGLAGLAAGGIIGGLLKAKVLGDESHLLAIAAACSFGGALLMFIPTWAERWIVGRFLSPSEADGGVGEKGGHIALEYAPTYSGLKLLAEDVGLVFIHPEARYVKISGLSYDYMIQARDVVRLELHRNRKTILLSYMVGNERLDFAIIPRSLQAELKRQVFGSSRSLFESVEKTLIVPPPIPMN